jgi:hypothetical protein
VLLGLLPLIALAVVSAFAFLCASAYWRLAALFNPVVGALLMTAFFAAIGMVALFAAVALRNRTKRAAQAVHQAQRAALFTDPAILETALATGRKFGWHRTIPVALLALLAVQVTSAIAARGRRASDEGNGE